eukprot:CAMPEP_0119357218 /NCGR_PEP_ID=MMETSP1334-20130426/5664_1 /TAXON_ID=127549 /ORGANISM="Calcidiscus leptoporus, Strain RCC1130" /LENGTH=61 /DNA_ID=CAMNT_0007371421 /DNA_START=518 /DNA_END=704 /DNA_ORIENTATION=+
MHEVAEHDVKVALSLAQQHEPHEHAQRAAQREQKECVEVNADNRFVLSNSRRCGSIDAACV